jgi:hypothetical protein
MTSVRLPLGRSIWGTLEMADRVLHHLRWLAYNSKLFTLPQPPFLAYHHSISEIPCAPQSSKRIQYAIETRSKRPRQRSETTTIPCCAAEC